MKAPPRWVRAAYAFPPHDDVARFQRMVDRVARNGVGCAHLERSPHTFLCVVHPSMVRCLACAQRHVERHTHVEEFSCDGCGNHIGGPTERADALMLAHPVEVDTTVSIGRGRRAAIGVVWLSGYGLCGDCFDPTGLA